MFKYLIVLIVLLLLSECESSIEITRQEPGEDCLIPCTNELNPLCAEWKAEHGTDYEIFNNPCYLKRQNECTEHGNCETFEIMSNMSMMYV